MLFLYPDANLTVIRHSNQTEKQKGADSFFTVRSSRAAGNFVKESYNKIK